MHSEGMSVGCTLPSRPGNGHRRRGTDRSPRPCNSPRGGNSRAHRHSRWRRRCDLAWRLLPGGIRRRVRRLVIIGAAGAVASAVLSTLAAVLGAWAMAKVGTRRVVVEGRSMVPTLEPGDRLLVVRLPRRWRLRPGDVVAVADPRTPERLLVKRVTVISEDGVTVSGDNSAESTDSRDFGPVERGRVWGRVVYRYSPPTRSGRVRSGRRGRRPPG